MPWNCSSQSGWPGRPVSVNPNKKKIPHQNVHRPTWQTVGRWDFHVLYCLTSTVKAKHQHAGCLLVSPYPSSPVSRGFAYIIPLDLYGPFQLFSNSLVFSSAISSLLLLLVMNLPFQVVYFTSLKFFCVCACACVCGLFQVFISLLRILLVADCFLFVFDLIIVALNFLSVFCGLYVILSWLCWFFKYVCILWRKVHVPWHTWKSEPVFCFLFVGPRGQT